MALEFGFNKGKCGDEKVWTERYQALSDEDKDFYHNSLPWLMMGVSISYVSPKTIPEIVKRHSLCPIIVHEECDEAKFGRWLTEYLPRFIGFETNVGMETDAKFLKKVGRMANLNLKGNSYKMWKEYKKEVYGDEREEM